MPLNRIIERILFGARWLLVPMYLGMAVLLVMLAVFFVGELIHALLQMRQMTENDLLILSLSLVDLVLTANLVVVVIVSGYESFVRRVEIDSADPKPEWMGRIDFSNLKLRLLGAITVIGVVHVLRSFLEVDAETERNLLWQVVIVVTFGLLAVMLAVTDKLTDDKHSG